MKIENLKRLSTWLSENITEDRFYLNHFRSNEEDVYKNPDEVINDCDSIGCAIGWSPFIPGLELKEIDYNYSLYGVSVNWRDYCERIYGIRYGDLNHLWNFLFSNFWVEYDNTLSGFLDRLDKTIQYYEGNTSQENNHDHFEVPWL